MKKKMIQRGLLGFPLGIAIGFVITVIIRRVVGYCGGAEGFYAAARLHLIRPLRGHLSPCGSVGPRI